MSLYSLTVQMCSLTTAINSVDGSQAYVKVSSDSTVSSHGHHIATAVPAQLLSPALCLHLSYIPAHFSMPLKFSNSQLSLHINALRGTVTNDVICWVNKHRS